MSGHTIKDNFSERSELYAQFRPVYPKALYDWIFSLVNEKKKAWDCGTGNGQVAVALAEQFDFVFGTDISRNQLLAAKQNARVSYLEAPADKTEFPDLSFDLITVAQAIHWFNFEGFYKEVNRTLKPAGLLVVFGYDLPAINPAIDKKLNHFYLDTTGPYWDPERKYIDDHYQHIPFPFDEIQAPQFSMQFTWTIDQFTGFLKTWSAVKHFMNKNGFDPVDEFHLSLAETWPAGEKLEVVFPMFFRAGRKKIQMI